MGFFDQAALDRLFDRLGPGPDDPRERRDETADRSADVSSAAIALESFRRVLDVDHEDRVQLARARFMAEERANEMFGCGIVSMPGALDPDPWHEGRVEVVVPVTVMVTADAFVIVREGIEDLDAEPMVESGRFARADLIDVTVTDRAGQVLAEPAEDGFDPPTPCLLLVRWRGSGGQVDQDAYAFRSSFVAGEAARRFRRAAVGSG